MSALRLHTPGHLARRSLRYVALALFVGAQSGGLAQAQELRQSAQVGEAATQRIDVRKGANLVSLHVVPADPKIEAVLADVLDKTLVVRNGAGQTYAPSHGVEDFDTWPWWEAVHLYALEPFTIEVTGRRIESDSEIELPAGWSQIPFLLSARAPVEDALASIGHALTRIDDVEGRTYSAAGGGTLTSLVPGAGYRVHLSEPAVLTYAPNGSSATFTVETIDEMLALQGLSPGNTVDVTDPSRGGRFRATDSGCTPDGGTCYLPRSASEPTTASLGSSSNAVVLYDGASGGIGFESLRLHYGADASDSFPAVMLHGHGGGRTELDLARGAVAAGHVLRTNTSGPYRVDYRYATSSLRLERRVKPITLEGVTRTSYVRPEWWGATPYPDSWRPDTSTPAPSDDPTLDPDVARYDATHAIGTALNAAHALAARTGREHYVVLCGMYGYSGVIETLDGAPLKGERDGVRDGQGLRVIKGAPWRAWATDEPATAEYAQPKRAEDYLLKNGHSWVVVRHGRDTEVGRIVDLEIDGNLAENDYVFSADYRRGSGPGGNQIWPFRVDELMQNTARWNGFSVHSTAPFDTPEQSNARLENVHIHDVGGNGVLGNDWTHFGGSRDIRVGNVARNHGFYGVATAPGTEIVGIDLYGFHWKSPLEVNQGAYRDVSYDLSGPSPYTGDPLEVYASVRNDGPDPDLTLSRQAGGRAYWGETVRFDGVQATMASGSRPRLGMFKLAGGDVSFSDVHIRADASDPLESAFNVFTASHSDKNELSAFDISRIRIDPALKAGSVFTARAQRNVLTDAMATDQSPVGKVDVRPGSNPERQLTLIRRVPAFGGVKIWPSGVDQATDAGFDVLVEGTPDEPILLTGGEPLTWKKLDPHDADVQNNCRVAWRDVVADSWDYDSNDAGTRRDHYLVQYFERVERQGRTSEDEGALSQSPLTNGSFVDVPTNLFFAPQASEYVQVSGRDADRFEGWELAPQSETYAPVLRLFFRGTSPVSADWEAAIRPIPDDLRIDE